jgi:Uma2 family endonuclease
MQVHESSKSIELHGTVKLDYSNFSLIPYDGLGHHLLNGVHIKHQTISNYISFKLTDFSLKNQLGTIFTAPIDVKFSEKDGYQPDLLFIESTKLTIIQDKIISGAPTLIIEISEESAQSDNGWKKDLAEKYAVQEYWVVDLKYQVTEIFVLEESKLVSKGIFKKGELIKSHLKILEEFQINLNGYL